MKKNWCAILLSMLVICLATLNVITIIELKSAKIMDYHQVGLSSLVTKDIKEMFVDEGNNPNLCGIFNDQQIAEKIRDIIKKGCYQKCSAIITDSSPGSNSYPFLRLTTENHTFAIAIAKEKIRISIDGTSQCYYSNIRTEMKDLIDDILNTYFNK